MGEKMKLKLTFIFLLRVCVWHSLHTLSYTKITRLNIDDLLSTLCKSITFDIPIPAVCEKFVTFDQVRRPNLPGVSYSSLVVVNWGFLEISMNLHLSYLWAILGWLWWRIKFQAGYHLGTIRDAPYVMRTKWIKKFTLSEIFSWFQRSVDCVNNLRNGCVKRYLVRNFYLNSNLYLIENISLRVGLSFPSSFQSDKEARERLRKPDTNRVLWRHFAWKYVIAFNWLTLLVASFVNSDCLELVVFFHAHIQAGKQSSLMVNFMNNSDLRRGFKASLCDFGKETFHYYLLCRPL